MLDLVGIPASSAALFFVAGIILGTCIYRRSNSTTPEEVLLSKRLERAKFAWKRRRNQCFQSKNHNALVKSLHIEAKAKQLALDSLKRNCESLEASLNQLEYDYLEQKEQLNRQVRRNRMLNTQLSEVIEAKTKLDALHHSSTKQQSKISSSQSHRRDRLVKEISTRPLIISDRVKLHIPRKASDSA